MFLMRYVEGLYRYVLSVFVISLIFISTYIPPSNVAAQSQRYRVDGLFIYANASGIEYPAIFRNVEGVILLRDGVDHNLSISAYGYKPIEMEYTPVNGDILDISLDASPLIKVDAIAPGYSDLPMSIIKYLDGYEDIFSLTSLEGLSYIYIPYNPGDEIEVHLMPPHDLLFWKTILNLSNVEPYLRDFGRQFSGYTYIAPVVPAPLVRGVDTDHTIYTITGSGQENITVLNGVSRVLEGYVKTQSGEPLRNAIVAVKPERFYRYIYTFTDENGYYRFENYIPFGKIYISVIYRGYVLPRKSFYVFSLDKVYNITLPDFIKLEGYYKDMNGRPIPDALLVLHGGGSTSIAYTDENGFYTLYVPRGQSTYTLSQKWGNTWLRDLFLSESDIIDGFENLTAYVEIFEVRGRVLDSTTGSLLGYPIIRFEGNVLDVNLDVSQDVLIDESGEFRVLLPRKMTVLGIDREVEWKIYMVDYYYSGNSIINTPTIFSSDIDLGDIDLNPPSLAEVTLNISFNSMPKETPVLNYLFSTWYNDVDFNISLSTNASFRGISPGVFRIDGGEGELVFELVTPLGMKSNNTFGIPKNLMSGDFIVEVDGVPYTYEIVGEDQNNTYIRIYLNGGSHQIRISASNVIPEFKLLGVILIISILVAIYIRVKFKDLR